MQKFSNLLLSSVCAVALLAGCSGKDGDPGPTGATGSTGPQGPSGQNLTGTVFGFINPVDEYGNALSKSGVTVTIDGVTPATTATTNADGRYEFANLRNGTYNLTFSRTGLASFRRLGIGHVGGDQPTFLGTNTLSAVSTTTIGNVSIASVSSTGASVNIPFANAGAPSGAFLRFAIYASSTPGVTSANGTLLFTTSATTSPFNTTLSKATLNSAGFASGSPIYVAVYATPSVLTGYTDPTNGRVVYSGLGTVSNQVAFIVP